MAEGSQSPEMGRGRFLKLLAGGVALLGLGALFKVNNDAAKNSSQAAAEQINAQNAQRNAKRGEEPQIISPDHLPKNQETMTALENQPTPSPTPTQEPTNVPLWERKAGTAYPTKTSVIFSPDKLKQT